MSQFFESGKAEAAEVAGSADYADKVDLAGRSLGQPKKFGGGTMNTGFALPAAVAFAWMIGSNAASATETIKFRFISHNVGLLTMDAADGVEGHVIGAAKFSGIVTFEGGASGTVTYLANIDYVKGSGNFTLYETLKFEDGTIRLKGGGPARLNGSRTEFPDGKFEVVGGEGKYKGATGTVDATGVRLVPFSDGGDTLEDGVIHLN